MNPTPTHNETGWTCYELWQRRHHTASLSSEPNFPLTPRIYIPSGAAVIDFTDIEDAVKMLRAKGFGCLLQMLILANPQESEAIQTWRNGKRQRSSRRPPDRPTPRRPQPRSRSDPWLPVRTAT